MRIEDLEYHAPKSLAEASVLLNSLGGDAKVMAGGTDVLADLKQGIVHTGNLVFLGEIGELKKIEMKKDGLWIGAMVTPNQLARSEAVQGQVAGLGEAGSVMGGNQIRNLATIGGNLCSAVPSADLAPSLLTVEAELLIAAHAGERKMPLKEFFLGPRKTALKADEIVAAVCIPLMTAETGTAYEKFQLRGASALAVVGVAARVTLKGGKIDKALVAVGASAPTPLLVEEIATFLKGKEASEKNIAEAGELACKAVKPISDLRGSAEYRHDLARVLTSRALQRAVDRIQS